VIQRQGHKRIKRCAVVSVKKEPERRMSHHDPGDTGVGTTLSRFKPMLRNIVGQ
jgi:hypothetical protein